jgi:hypothetical protein
VLRRICTLVSAAVESIVCIGVSFGYAIDCQDAGRSCSWKLFGGALRGTKCRSLARAPRPHFEISLVFLLHNIDIIVANSGFIHIKALHRQLLTTPISLHIWTCLRRSLRRNSYLKLLFAESGQANRGTWKAVEHDFFSRASIKSIRMQPRSILTSMRLGLTCPRSAR